MKLSLQYIIGKFNTTYAKISIQVYLICVLQCRIADKFGRCLWVSLHWPQTPPPAPPPLLLARWVGYANRQTAHHTGISWASVPGPLAMRRRLRLKSKGAGIVELLLLLLLLLTHEMIIKTGDSNDSGACRQSAADNTRSHSANWAYCSCRQLVPIATIGRSVDQSISQSLESNRASVKFVIVIIISALCLRPAGAHTHSHSCIYVFVPVQTRLIFAKGQAQQCR